nr:MAG TPA: hypothetical protein [Caudoviricetes sp.]
MLCTLPDKLLRQSKRRVRNDPVTAHQRNGQKVISSLDVCPCYFIPHCLHNINHVTFSTSGFPDMCLCGQAKKLQ